MSTPLLQLDGVSKSFGGVRALTDVTMTVDGGEVHALCGENGAGKSTLIKILTGVVTPDLGDIQFLGLPLPTGHVHECERAGIAAVHQESTAFPDLNAVDNLFVGHEITRYGGWLLDRHAMRCQTRRILARLGERIDELTPIGELPLAQRQMVAMGRALLRNCRLLIMDEPTASLSSRETDTLLNVIRKLRSKGVSILYVSHRLEEVFSVADRVTVLRDGHFVATHSVADVSSRDLVRMMVGREIVDSAQLDRFEPRSASEPLLRVDSLSRSGAFEGISLSVSAGEIVGVAGLVGAGRSEMARAVFGVDSYDIGSVWIDGHPLEPNSVSASIRSGIGLVPEDRQHEGLVLPMSVAANLSMVVLPKLTRWGLVRRTMEQHVVQTQIERLAVKTASPRVSTSTLSGGNQQKLVLGKWLACQPRVLVLDEPTRGVDVGAKDQFHRLIRQLANDGVAVLLISSELAEVLSLSDRILVMREGCLVGELEGEDATQENVMALALPPGGSNSPGREAD